MAVNPLFQTYKHREKCISQVRRDILITQVKSLLPYGMAQQRSHASPGGASSDSRPTQAKRPRLDEPGEEEWDDDFVLTQEILDITESQAVAGPSTSHGPSSVVPMPSASGQHTFQIPASSASLLGSSRLRNQSSTSSSDSLSVYPQSSASLRRTASSDVSSAPGSLSVSSGNLSLSDQGTHVELNRANLVKNGSGDSAVVVTGLREELRITEERARSEKYTLEGHVKCLKEALHKQEQELERLRSERDERSEASALRHKEKEKELRQAVESLQTQMQFKEQDLEQMQKKCLALESRLASLQLPLLPPASALPSTSTGGVTMSQPQGSPDKSPRVRKISVKGPHTPEKGSFPSTRSFMSTADVSPQPKGPPPLASVSAGTMTTEDSASKGPLWQKEKNDEADVRRSSSLKLNIPVIGSRIPILGSQLFHYQCSSRGDMEDGGLLGLLQRLPSRLDLTELQYERDHNTERLSPVRKLRKQLSPDSLSKRAHLGQSPKSIVNQEHYLMALEGLKNLTNPVFWHQKGSVTAPQTGAQGPRDSAVPSKSTISPQHAAAQNTALSGPGGAVLFLPLLNDYLKHYINILSSGGSTQKIGSPVGSTGPSSTEGSSLDTLSSSLEMLLQQGAEYVNNMETLTLSALRVMHLLVCGDAEVRKAVLLSHWSSVPLRAGTSTDTSSSAVETDLERERVNGSGLEGDDEKSLTSSTASSILSPADSVACPRAMMHGLDILTKLVRLASPSQEVSGFSAQVVEAALSVLSALAARLSCADLPRLRVVVLRGILTECLQVHQRPDIIMQALTLFSCLAPAKPNVLAFCTKNESCTLLNVHLVCMHLVNQFRGKEVVPSYFVLLISKIIDVLTSLISYHENGVRILTDNNCRCSRQIIPSLVYAMFFLLRDYQLSLNTEVFQVLRKGILLLHSISLRDPNYQQHHGQVSMHYNPLILSLARIYKDQLDIPRAEMVALEDLAEEVDDCGSSSQDSDHEEAMVTG